MLLAIDLGPHTLAGKGLRIAIILLVALLLTRLSPLLIRRAERFARSRDEPPDETERRLKTVTGIIRSVVLLVVGIVALMLVLDVADINVAPLVAAAGVGGVALGFGAQSLVRDFFSGFFIILENQFRVGDVVEAAGKRGTVEQLNLRTTVLRDESGAVHVVPNGQIAVASNLTKHWARVVVDVPVPSSASLDSAAEKLRSVCRAFESDPRWAQSLLEPPSVEGIETLTDSAAELRVSFRVRPLAQWDAARELRRRIRLAMFETTDSS